MKLISAPLVACIMVGSVLLVKSYFPWWSSIAFLESSIFFIAGIIAGVRLPDLDLILPGFSHRSGISHSCFPAVLFWLVGWYSMAAGLAFGIALHLSSDLQPRSWTGGALIKFPLIGSIGLLSPIWILANILGCLIMFIDVLSAELIKNIYLTLITSSFVCIWYFYRGEKRPLLPMITLGFGILLVQVIRKMVTIKLVL